MKKLILTSILGICFLSAYSQNDKRTITIGSVTDAAPYCYTDDKGNFDGYSVDIIKTIMSRLGYNYSFLEFDRESSQTQGNNELNETVLSRCDLSLIAVPSVAYKRHHYFSTPYSQINYLVISKAENPFSGLRDLTDKDIVVQKNSVSDRRMKALQGD